MRSTHASLALLAILLFSFASVEAAPAARKDDPPFEVSGDVMPGDASGDVIEAHGHVKVTRGAFVLTADHLRYEKKTDSAIATGEVRVTQGEFALTCRRLRYQVGQQLAIAWEDPVLTRKEADDGNEKAEVELRATQITLEVEGERVTGLDRAELTRWLGGTGKRRTLDIRVTAEEIELDQVSRSCTFRGEVRIASPSLGARAERALLEEPLDRLTLVGSAQAWGIGPKGEQTDRVNGQKILHFLRGKRTLVFGSVQGRMRMAR